MDSLDLKAHGPAYASSHTSHFRLEEDMGEDIGPMSHVQSDDQSGGWGCDSFLLPSMVLQVSSDPVKYAENPSLPIQFVFHLLGTMLGFLIYGNLVCNISWYAPKMTRNTTNVILEFCGNFFCFILFE